MARETAARRGTIFPMKRSIIFVIGLALLAPAAWAMHVTRDESIVTFSSDGTDVLLALDAQGPEGGGSHGYRVVGPAGSVEFALSSDFSPGGGGRPQRVSASECEERAAELGRLLATRHFPKAVVDPRACSKRDRRAVVTVETPDAGSPVQVTIDKGRLMVRVSGRSVDLGAAMRGGSQLQGTLSTSGKLLVVTDNDEERYGQTVRGVWRASGAGFELLK